VTFADQLQLAPVARLPLDLERLLGLDPASRGEFYNLLDLDSWQRGCAEEALRMLTAGTYGQHRPKEKTHR